MADLLLVDDDLDLAEILAEFLVLAGHVVRVAHNGRDGLVLLDERRPDLIVLDVEMPVLSGPEMALEMFVHDAGLEEIPILLLSGAANLRQIASEVGTPYVLDKPISPEILMTTLGRALRERTPPSRFVAAT
jgi:DNA-binding response OmpR family regulator